MGRRGLAETTEIPDLTGKVVAVEEGPLQVHRRAVQAIAGNGRTMMARGVGVIVMRKGQGEERTDRPVAKS